MNGRSKKRVNVNKVEIDIGLKGKREDEGMLEKEKCKK